MERILEKRILSFTNKMSMKTLFHKLFILFNKEDGRSSRDTADLAF